MLVMSIKYVYTKGVYTSLRSTSQSVYGL